MKTWSTQIELLELFMAISNLLLGCSHSSMHMFAAALITPSEKVYARMTALYVANIPIFQLVPILQTLFCNQCNLRFEKETSA